MIYGYVIGSLLLLFLLSRLLSSQISKTLYRITRSEKLTIYLVAILFFPGVVLHEVSHWLMAQLLFVPTGKVEFWPVLRGNELKLGSVAVAKTDPVRRTLIGCAPFLFGTAVLLILLFFSSQMTFIPSDIRAIFIGYLVFEIGNTMFSSRKDLEGTVELLLSFAILGGLGYFIGIRIPDGVIQFFLSAEVTEFLQKTLYYLFFPISIDVIIIALLWMGTTFATRSK